MAIFKRCSNCHQLYNGKKCPDCSARYARNHAKKRQRENENRKLYGSTLWKKCRKNILIKYQGLDIWLLAAGQVHKCSRPQVHHIIERDEAPDLIYDIDNLISVTKESHEEIHRLYLIDKAEALARIRRGIQEFQRLFG